nr:YcxB family protein [Flavobacterium sp. MC2016-06]
MYFKHLYKERVTTISSLILFLLILFDFFRVDHNNDMMQWIIRSLILIIFFLLIQYSFVNTICKLIFRLAKKLLKFDSFISKYKFNFTSSLIHVHSPLGEFAHKWSEIEKAILTKDFFFLYVKKRNGYIITISNKDNNQRNMEELITFIERHVTHVTKV